MLFLFTKIYLTYKNESSLNRFYEWIEFILLHSPTPFTGIQSNFNYTSPGCSSISLLIFFYFKIDLNYFIKLINESFCFLNARVSRLFFFGKKFITKIKNKFKFI